MGVQGLTTFVEGHRHFLQDVRFRDSRLVIDGCSLYFRLYFNHVLDQQHGGDYDTFACMLHQFFSALAACNIQPFVVLDGGIDPSDKKFDTLCQRLQCKIRDADGLSQGHRKSVLPILIRDVFVQVLAKRGVPLVQCPFEADREIACLAHQWNCPVLTNDSDFFIFDLPGGYLPFSFFQWTHLNGKANHRYISARCYTTHRLCHWFKNMNPKLLPLCAVLKGNDYGCPKDVEKLLGLIDTISSVGKGKSAACRIEGLLTWLSSFSSPTEALDEVCRLMGGKEGLSAQLWARMQEYSITPQCNLALWFSRGEAVPWKPIPGLPERLWLAVAQGLLAPMVVDAAVMRKVLLTTQVENCKLASTNCCAKAIRQAMYGILLRGPGDNSANENISQGARGGRRRGRGGSGGGQMSRSGDQGPVLSSQLGVNVAASPVTVQARGSGAPVCVEEYDRVDLTLKKFQVAAVPPRTPLSLDQLHQVPVAVRRGVLLEVLGTKEAALAPLPLHLRLAVAATAFWLKNAKPTPSLHQLQTLILCMVYGELSWNSQAAATPFQHPTSQPSWAAECNLLAGLDRLRVNPAVSRGFDIVAAHSFSQWQACLKGALYLNQLLLMPLPEPHLSCLFSGTLAHGLNMRLKGGQTSESLLSRAPLSRQLYSTLLDAARNCSSNTHPHSSAATEERMRGGGHRGRRGRGRGRAKGRGRGEGGARPPMAPREELNNRFALLMSDESSDW